MHKHQNADTPNINMLTQQQLHVTAYLLNLCTPAPGKHAVNGHTVM